MDQRDEFSKWMSAVEEALSIEGKELAEDVPAINECGCGNWDCPICFPEQGEMQAADGHNPETTVVIGGVDIGEPGSPEFGHNDKEHEHGKEFAAGIDSGRNDIESDEFSGFEEASMFDEEEMDFEQAEEPRSGKGVKLGDIVTKTEFRKTGGVDSPMTYGEDNLDEEPAGMEVSQPLYGEEDPNVDDAMEMISSIKYMQDMGLSKASQSYDENRLASMNIDQLRKFHDEVMGGVTSTTSQGGQTFTTPTGTTHTNAVKADMEEETDPAKPTRTKTRSHLDDLDDVLNPTPSQPLANIGGSDDDENELASDEPTISLPTASRDATQNRLRNMAPDYTMRDFINRANPELVAMARAQPQMQPETNVALRTARDVPAVISSSLRAAGIQSPEWDKIRNLPGMNDDIVRALGSGMMNTMTSTPVGDIKVIANLIGRGPNTSAEMNAVSNWLKNNAQDLGDVIPSHGEAAPGYEVEAHNYKINGILFHMVKDHGGDYIYAWPARDTKQPAGVDQGQDNIRVGNGRNTPRLGESTREEDMQLNLRPTLFEQLKWDEEIKAILKESIIEEDDLDESSLSKLIGDQKGGQRLVQWLHRKHKLGNLADLQPQPFNERMLWKEFKRNPDNFVVVAATDGVAGIKPYEKMIRDRMEAARKKGKEYDPGGDSTLQYQIIAFTDDGQQVDPALLQPAREPGEEREVDPTVMKARMGKISGKDTQNPDNVFNLLADQIGALRTVYFAGGAVERDKMKGRADMKKTADVSEADAVKQIFKRVRPVLKTLANQALSQINNRAKRYIDGGNFEAATKISQSGNKLKQFLATIDTSGDVNLDSNWGSQTRDFTNQITKAVQAASGSRPGTPEYKDFLNRAASGSAMELKPVLDALRDNLVSLA